ncbi:hypothetical protein AB0B94_07630 [Micromonospora sp. NPDC048986]|uniref:hypothetical protein n=1 Tax=Micromonospora sp. NPDC048986 TaxID=3155644 RepID=UPI0033FD6788
MLPKTRLTADPPQGWSPGRRTVVASLAIAAMAATTVIAVQPAAFAAPVASAEARPASVRTAQIDGATLRQGTVAAKSINSTADVKSGQRLKEHLDDAARNGRLVDTLDTHLSTVADPFTPGATIQLAWDGDKAPESVRYARRDNAEGTADVAMGVQVGGNEAVKERPRKATAGSSGGSGYAAGFNSSNMIRTDNYCTDTWFVPSYSSSRDHKITSCFEQWEQNATVHFVYNRWALWSPAPPPFGLSANTVDFYVAARPWSGYASRFRSLNDWAPRAPTSACDTKATFTLGGTFAGVNGSVAIPINVCQQYRMDITASAKKIGIDFDGSRSGQMYMDVAGDFSAINATTALLWADYNWVELRLCSPSVCGSEQWVAKDSGW